MKLLVALALVAIVGSAIARPARDLKSDLITKGQDLVKKADEAVTKLTAANKAQAVTAIKAEEARITKLVADLTAATDDAKVKTLERELGALEARLDHELTRANGTPANPPKTPTDPATPVAPANPSKRDAKSDLIEKANALLKKADDAITKLEADKKTQQAAQVKTQEAHIKKLIADLTAATDDAKVKNLERELTGADLRLDHEILRANGTPANPPKTPVDPVTAAPATPSKRDLKSDLITKGNDLVKKVEDAAAKLEADKKTREATMLKTQEAHLKKAVADLTAATDDAKVKALEHELNVLEARLAHELTRIAQPGTPAVDPPKTPTDPATPVAPANPSKRDAKSDLIEKANALLKKADDAVTKLEADKKTREATALKAEESHIKKIVADLTAATDAAKVTALERELTMADTRLDRELTRIAGTPANPPTPVTAAPASPSKRDAKSDLIEKANALLKKAEDAVTKLEADKKTQQATQLKTQEAHIKKLVADLTAATDDAKVKTLERELTTADARLDHEILRASGTPANPPTPVTAAPAPSSS